MNNLKIGLFMVRKDCFMCTIDLSDAYYSVPVAIIDQKCLMFKFASHLCKFVYLRFGLTLAPRLFTKVSKPLFAALHKERHDIMSYLDEFCLGKAMLNAKLLSQEEFSHSTKA